MAKNSHKSGYTGPSSKPHDSGVAVAIFVIQDKKILFMKRKGSTGDGTWAVPGGGVEYMEHPIDSAKRELNEETGIFAKDMSFVSYSNDTHQDANLHYVTLLFICTKFSGVPTIMEPEKCSNLAWFRLDSLPVPLFPVLTEKLKDKKLIKSLLANL